MLFALKSFSQQTVSEKVKYRYITLKCVLCGKIKKSNSVDWVHIANEDVSDKIYLEGLSKGALSMAFGNKETNCNGSRFGEHEYKEIVNKIEYKLVTAVKGSAAKRKNSYSEYENNKGSNDNSVEFNMDAYKKAAGELNDSEKKSSNNQGGFDMDAFNRALKKSKEEEKLKRKKKSKT
jgi:hypothetical protein